MERPERRSGALPDRGVICPVLIGRRGPLRTVETLLERASGGHGGILLVAGEAGIGKSRLLRTAADDARQRGFFHLHESCFEADRAVPYAPLLDLVRSLASTRSPALAAHVLAPAAAELVRAFPELSFIFSDLPPLEPLDPEHERRRLFGAVAQTIVAIGRTQPVLFTLEDAHWADEATLDLILHLARGIEHQPVVLALSYRSDEVRPRLNRLLAELDRTRAASEAALARFSREELSEMLGAIFDDEPPGGDFVDRLHALTDGNPFFAEEVLRALIATGDVARRPDGSWHARPLERIQVPRTAVEAVRRRLAALPVSAREVASVAAVAGRRFDFTLLRALTGYDELALLADMRELVAAQLVVEESPDRFVFRHALTREAIVGELLARERAALHGRVADELQRNGEVPDSHIESYAYHTFEARDWTRALMASTRAAEHSLTLHAPREAAAHAERATVAAAELGRDPGARVRLAHARALETLGDFHGAHEAFSAALEDARRAANAVETWQALHALGVLWTARDFARAGEYRREALAVARETGNAALVARSLNAVANWHLNLEQPEPAISGHAEALALFEQIDDRRGVAETIDLLAMTHFIAGDLAASAAQYERAIPLHESLGDRRALARSLALLCLDSGSLHVFASAPAPTVRAALLLEGDRPVRMARGIGWRAGEAFTQFVMADALAWRGIYDRAIPMARESLANAGDLQHMQWQCGAARTLGHILLDLESPADALGLLERAYGIARQLRSQTWIRWCGAPYALALARTGAMHRAYEVLDEASVESAGLPTAAAASPTLGARLIALTRAKLAVMEGNPGNAIAIIDARFGDDATPAPGVMLTRARALDALGESMRAAELLNELREVAGDARPILWRADAALGHVHRKLRQRDQAQIAFERARFVAEECAARIPEDAIKATFLREVAAAIPAARRPTARQTAKAEAGGLTRRERDVARLVAEGKSNRAVARALGIGERTVEGHVAAALAKLGFSSRVQLAAWAVQREVSP